MNLNKTLNNLIKMDLKKSLNLMGVDAISVINERTDQGIDSEGKKFKRYNPKYEDFKMSKGRTGKVDLTFTGELLNSMQYDVKGDTLTIEFPRRKHRNSKTGIDEIAETLNNERPFFELSQKELDTLSEKHIKKHIDGALNGL